MGESFNMARAVIVEYLRVVGQRDDFDSTVAATVIAKLASHFVYNIVQEAGPPKEDGTRMLLMIPAIMTNIVVDDVLEFADSISKERDQELKNNDAINKVAEKILKEMENGEKNNG